MSKYTNEEIAGNFHLWGTYVDPMATMTEEEFDKLSTDEKVKIIEDIWPDGDDQDDDE